MPFLPSFRRPLGLSGLALLAAASAAFAIEPDTSYLSNLSVRTPLAANQNVIVGGVVSGGSKSLLVRAGGPALNAFGLAGMADPKLDFFTGGAPSPPTATTTGAPRSTRSSPPSAPSVLRPARRTPRSRRP